LRVAAAQIACRSGDIAANLALHHAAIEDGRRSRVDILVFPELSLTDYQVAPDTRVLARAQDCAELRGLAESAGEMVVSVGFIELAAGRVYNAQALLQAGRVLHVHRKANLASYGALQESRHYAPGGRIEPVPIGRGWNAATLICADAWNPALPWLAALHGANLLLVPVASALDAVGDDFDNPAGWEVNLRHTALSYGVPVVMANHCGTRGGLRFWGGSRILDAFGREMARAGLEPVVVVGEIDNLQGERARTRLPTMRDATPVVVHAELARWINGRSLHQ
jgi:predicted amidohydrolase